MGAGPDRDQLLDRLVRLGHLDFDDFRLLDPLTVRLVLVDPAAHPDWPLALSNAPHVLLHFRHSANLQPEICSLKSAVTPSLSAIHAAQSRLTHRFAFDLLREKAPPLYDALPWHDWGFSIVARRFKLWQTRLLLAGDGTTLTIARCRKSAGVYVVEPLPVLARYIEKKGELEKVKRLRVLTHSLTHSLPLAESSADLAVIGSLPSLPTDNWQPLIREFARVCRNVLLVENNPLLPPLDGSLLTTAGFRPDSVDVRSLGPRRCWWMLGRQ
jgi:SAM-dependent methyltransferase